MSDQYQVPEAAPGADALKRAGDALKVSQHQFRHYFELGLIGMAITSPEKGCVDVNDELCKILGYERSELLRMTWEELTHPDDRAADLAKFESVMAGEIDGYSMDKRWIRKDGQVIYSTISVKCARRENGAVHYFFALLQDITMRKQAEGAPTASRAELERSVAEQTAQLRQVNEKLINEIVTRRHAMMESLTLGSELATEVAAMARLHDFSTRLLSNAELEPLLEEVLTATMALQEADFGCVQLYNAETASLQIITQRGLQQDFIDHFAGGRAGAAFDRALHQRERVIIEDIATDEEFAPHRHIAASNDFRAVQVTPLFSQRGEPLGVMSTYFRQPRRPSERESRLTDLYAVHAAEMIERKQTEKAVLHYQKELQALTARLMEAQENTSRYLARELHDDFSQKLAVLGIEMAALARQTSTPALSERLLDFVVQMGVLAEDLHRVARQLHPAILDDLGLTAAIKNECAAFAAQHGIATEFRPDGILHGVPNDVSLCLYRIAQEWLRNIGKHTHSAGVRVTLSAAADEITMEIAQTGDGFDLDAIKGKGGLGLISMEERARLVNGTFSIRSQSREGTLLRVCVPVPSQES